jgi:hypothetical protein
MNLHWDGNNASLEERNLSAALGAGATPSTYGRESDSIARVTTWLRALEPPASPYRPDPQTVEEGRKIYMADCASCHGHQDGRTYRFEGQQLGEVVLNARLGTDRARLDSYTEEFRRYQTFELLKGSSFKFEHFKKTNGYANMPLDGLWLRAPYLHNGSVPSLADLLQPPDKRPAAFVRGIDVLDGAKGGFVAPACDPALPLAAGFCFDTRRPGNGNQGHVYGVDRSDEEKARLLAYLLTF